ncbi:INTEGRAL MEMBRANE PROTEIN (Rhomboid family) [hydrothermal vent metagenome]|uniref:INTEGRAL MEMBRANE PROTEIN (Rhomboid family) n=1 Tax=hydrothermal vent metagenome TaxID=652676 RepID=A0A3B1AAA2_9ZZZZ
MLDTRRSIETPEGVELGLRLAGPVVRGYAWIIDVLIRTALYTGIWVVFLLVMGKFGMGLALIAVFLVEWFYPVVFELYNMGATPGKRSMGIKVVHDDGTEVTLQSSLLRNLLRAVDFLPFLYGFGLLSMMFNRDFKRLGDLTAGTIVIYTDKLSEVSNIKKMSPLMPPISLAAPEQKAIIQYAERLDLFTPQRCSELANILEEVTHEKDEKGVQRLLQYANWMMGRR